MMNIDNLLLNSLLFEEESNCLDFKRDQYQFINSNNEQKCELLKDILSFANGWRRTDAYILIGVKERKGEKNEVFGINELLDDSQLQQFINSKVQKPISFIYKNIKYDDKQIGVIHIPVQDRPFFLTKDFGKLKKNVVYIRRGTSTDEASPDEILTMKDSRKNVFTVSPDLNLSLVNETGVFNTMLEVEPYEVLEQRSVIDDLSNLVLDQDLLNLVDRHAEKLDSLQDRYPDGNEFYPYKAKQVHDFNTTLLKSIEMAKNDFKMFCKYSNLFTRSFELKESPKAQFRRNRNAYPFYASLNLVNNGTASAEGLIVYLEDSDSVKFFDWKSLTDFNIKPYVEYPEDIAKIIEKAKELDKGIDNPIVTMYERVTGSKWDHFRSPLSDLSHIFGNIEKPYVANRMPGKTRIIIKKDLLHNHNLVFYAENIFLCPMVGENEIGEFNYAIHAKNLPKPIRSSIQIKGKNITNKVRL